MVQSIKINLWSGPRNISTALMYSFAQRADCSVVDEPLYAHYLRETGIEHPGQTEILSSQNQDGKQVIQGLMGAAEKTVYFFKQMTHHLVNLPLDWLAETKNVLLIRHPAKVLASYSKVIENPTLADIGIEQSATLFEQLQTMQAHCVVLDSDVLLENPKQVLEKLCSSCQIPFDEQMLQWEAGARKEDGVWAKYWYANVHRSTGFGPPKKEIPTVSPHLEPILAEAMQYYDFLQKKALM